MGLSALVPGVPGGATRTRSDNAVCGATRTRFDTATCVLPSGAARMSLETMLSTPAWISFRRCNPHAPGGATRTRLPFPCSSGSAPRTWPGRCLACVQRCLAGKRFSPVSALLPAGALTVSHTRRDDASPASVSRPWWWARSGTAAIVQSGRAHVSIAIPASDGGLKLFVELPLAALPLHPSLLAASSVVNGIPHSCCCGATRQHLWFEQMKGYP